MGAGLHLPPPARIAQRNKTARATLVRLSGRDLTPGSAGATLYGALAVVPSVLVAISLASVLLGRDQVRHYARLLAGTLPTAMGSA
jgi:membrane protein